MAEHLDLPAFNHHRASDDAAMVAYMLIPFFEKMERELGIHRLQEINGEMLKLRPQGQQDQPLSQAHHHSGQEQSWASSTCIS